MGGGIGVNGFPGAAIVEQAVPARGQERGQFLGRRQRNEVTVGLDFGIADLERPGLVVFVVVTVKPLA